MTHVFSKDDIYNKIIFFDENGSSSTLKSIKKSIVKGEKINEERRYFTLTACVFETHNYFKAVKAIRRLVKKYWGNPDEQLYFIREKYKRKKATLILVVMRNIKNS